jgi:hypothetical protein
MRVISYLSVNVAVAIKAGLFLLYLSPVNISQQVVVISYRRFGTTYRSHPQCSKIKKKTLANLPVHTDRRLSDPRGSVDMGT